MFFRVSSRCKSFQSTFILLKVLTGTSIILRCLIFKVLAAFFLRSFSLVQRLYYLITLLSICQAFFETFFKIFSNFFIFKFLLLFSFALSCDSFVILPHSSSFCQLFFSFFSLFLLTVYLLFLSLAFSSLFILLVIFSLFFKRKIRIIKYLFQLTYANIFVKIFLKNIFGGVFIDKRTGSQSDNRKGQRDRGI